MMVRSKCLTPFRNCNNWCLSLEEQLTGRVNQRIIIGRGPRCPLKVKNYCNDFGLFSEFQGEKEGNRKQSKGLTPGHLSEKSHGNF